MLQLMYAKSCLTFRLTLAHTPPAFFFYINVSCLHIILFDISDHISVLFFCALCQLSSHVDCVLWKFPLVFISCHCQCCQLCDEIAKPILAITTISTVSICTLRFKNIVHMYNTYDCTCILEIVSKINCLRYSTLKFYNFIRKVLVLGLD
jgi:hypothetical protein